MRLNLICILPIICAGAAAQSNVSAPVFGFLFDSGAVRPIYGSPRAAVVGDPLDAGFAMAAAAVSPAGNYVLATAADTGRTSLVRLGHDRPDVVELEGGISSPDGIVFSASGGAAMLYQRASGRVQILTGLPDTPAVKDVITSDGLAVTAMAIGNDGRGVIASASGVYLIATDLNLSPMPLPGDVTAVAFGANGDLVAATRAGDIFVVRNVSREIDVRQVYAGDGSGELVGAGLSFNGLYAYTADTRGLITAVEIATGAVKTASCQCIPSGMTPVNAGRHLQLTGRSGRPTILIDGTAEGLQLWFVPAADQRSSQ